MSRVAAVLPTRFGPLRVVVDDEARGDRGSGPGAVVDAGLLDLPAPAASADGAPQHRLLGLVADAVAAWDSGADLAALDRVPVAITGDGFRARVWRALRGVPAGTTVSYGELAGMAGSARAARAVGSACAANPFAPFVPCHRVIRGDGAVGGYGYRPERKRAMLDHEGARP